MTLKEVAFDISATSDGHAARGVGFYVNNLVQAFGDRVRVINVFTSDLSEYDVVHIPFFNPFIDTFPKNIENKNYIVTIHDLIPLIYPKHYPPGIRGKLRFISQKKKAQNAKAILTDSQASKKDIIRFLEIDPKKVHVVYLAPQTGIAKQDSKQLAEIVKKYDLPKKYVLYVGDINYNKNIANLIKACDYAKLPLVIVGKQAAEVEDLGQDVRNLRGPMDWLRFLLGKPHPELAHYKSIYQAFIKNKNVYRVGFVPARDFSGIMQLALVYCQPSFYEGFGLPVLEAFQVVLPVVASRTQALVEVGSDACLYVNPKDYKAMGEKLKQVVGDTRLSQVLIEKGKQRLKQFSWKKTAEQTYEVYKLVL